jgi:hypothetical protein
VPSTPQAYRLTDTYRSNLLDLRARTAHLAASAWMALSLRDLDASYGRWRSLVGAAVEGVKRQGVTLSDAYLATYVAAELGTHPQLQGLDPSPFVDTVDGRSLADALTPPLFTVKRALAEGRQDALRLGLVRATRVVSEEVLDAPRRALGDLMANEDRVDGWKRVIGANPCGACLAQADGRVHEPTDAFHRHGHCRCVREPVVRGVPDTFRRPTGREFFDGLSPEDQAALFHGRGGAEKADLIRSGAVPLDALVRREAQVVTPDQFTEASLDDLRALANRPGDPGPTPT